MQSPKTLLRSPQFSIVVVLAACVVVTGCATRTRAPVEDRTLGRSAPARAPAAAPITAEPGNEALPRTYTVKRGDTLHQIALDTGLDYRELAAWNNIENVNRIYVGQVLRLTPPGAPSAPGPVAVEPNAGADTTTGVVTAPLRTPPPIGEAAPNAAVQPPPPASPSVAPRAPNATPNAATNATASVKTTPKAIKEPYSEQAVRDLNLAASAGPAPVKTAPPPAAPAKPATASEAAPAVATVPGSPPAGAGSTNSGSGTPGSSAPGGGDALAWAWPAKGKIVTNFSETANLKGIDIAGTAGEPVRASAPGRVVYAGNGLRGYGKLIIIKHNDTYLSAYAHNREILVKEGQQVTRGQKIAEMGNTDADQVKLHFEIRRHGKPMDPTKYLPPL